MKKGQAALEFFMTYGWAILIILAAIGALWYYGIFAEWATSNTDFSDDVTGEKYATYVCNNLDNGTAIFKSIVDTKFAVEESLSMSVKNIYGGNTSARMWDTNGVMCNVLAEVCHPQYLFCFKIDMVVPVNYTEWEVWNNGTN